MHEDGRTNSNQAGVPIYLVLYREGGVLDEEMNG